MKKGKNFYFILFTIFLISINASLISAAACQPIITINSPVEGANNNSINHSLTVTNGGLCSTSGCWLSKDNGTTNVTMQNLAGNVWNYTETLPEGNYIVQYWCNDTNVPSVFTNVNISFSINSWTKTGTVYTCPTCIGCSSAIANAGAGNTIELNTTLSGISGTCIDFGNKSNVIFNCQNNSIIGDGTGTDYGIYLSSVNNNTIRNCNFSQFHWGIYLTSSNNNTLTNITANNNSQYGIVFGGSNNNILTTITINNNLYSGIALSSGSNNNILTTITANNNSQSGIYLLQSSNNNTLIGIMINYNLVYGISLLTSRNNTLTNIIANNNGRGIFLSSSNSTILTNITVKDNNFSGVHFYSSSYYNILNNSHIENNTYYGLYFLNQSARYPEYNLIYNNYFNNTFNYYNSTNLTNFFNTTKISGTNIIGGVNIGGNFWAHPNNTGFSQLVSTCADTDSDGICDSSYNLDSVNYDYLPLILLSSCTESWGCTSWSTCSGGSQTRTCTDSNACGTTTNKPAESQSCTSGGGGGALPTTNQTFNPNNPVEILINVSQLDLIKIIIEVAETVSGASFSIIKRNILNINEEIGVASGKLYQAFNVTAKGITNDKIRNVTIYFKVNKTWLFQNNGTSSDIRLHRKENSSARWEVLLTNLKSQDDNYYYFSALSPGFSTFVIFYGRYDCQSGIIRCYSGQTQLCLGNSTWLITEKCKFGCEDGKCIKTAPQSTIIYTLMIAVVSVAIIITSYFLLIRIRKNKKRR